MDNRYAGLGLTAAISIAITASMLRGGPGSSAAPADQSRPSQAAVGSAQATAGLPTGRSGADLLRGFLGDADQPRFQLRFLIATLPDPYDSHLDWAYDASLEAIRRAFETSGYVSDRFWFPPAGESVSPTSAAKGLALRETHPGVMLFRKPDTLCLLYLVPEVPTSGIYATALRTALVEQQTLRQAARADTGATVIRVLGPSFSGSALSLRHALLRWRSEHPSDSFAIVSGSATSADNLDLLGRPAGMSFRATVHTDRELLRLFSDSVLGRLDVAPSQVAVLRESSTQYGQGLQGQTGESFVDIPFPMSISSLRSEYQRNPAAATGSAALPGGEAPRLPLDLLDPARPKVDLPVTSRLSPVAVDLMLDELARTLSRRGIRMVGLLATDIRDKLFLGEELRRRIRDIQFFTFENNILYLRSDRNMDLRGMLVLSTYPLILENQWSTSDSSETHRFTFGSDGAEGVYNATLLQLGNSRRMLDYRVSGRGDASHRPPVWLTTVGHGTFLPVTVFSRVNADSSYLADGCGSETGCATPPARPWSGLRLPFLALAGMLLSGFALAWLTIRSLMIDREVRSHIASREATSSPDLRPRVDQVMDASLRLHGRLYELLRIIAVTGVFLAAWAPGLRVLIPGGQNQAGFMRSLDSLFSGNAVLLGLLALLSSVATLAALVSGLASVVGLLRAYGPQGWEYFRRGPFADRGERWTWRAEVFARGLVALFGLLYLALSLGFASDTLFESDRRSFWLFFRRASEIDSMVSPLLPLILGGLGYAIWCSWHLRRIALLRNECTFESALEVELTNNPRMRLSIGAALRYDLRRSAHAAAQVRRRLFQVIPDRSSLIVLAAFAVLGIWLWPQFGRSLEALLVTESHERRGFFAWLSSTLNALLPHGSGDLPYFDWLFRIMLLTALFATAWGATRLVAVWAALCQCLEGFARSPIVIAFERLPPRLARLTRLSLPGSPSIPVGAVADVQWLHLQRIFAAREAEFRATLAPEHAAVLGQIAGLMREPAAQSMVPDLAGRQALTARFGSLHAVLRELWRLEPMPEDVATLEKALLKDFERVDAGAGPDSSTTLRLRRSFAGPVRMWLRGAEEYAVTVIVEYIEWVIYHLRILALFMLLSLILTTLLISSYPYPPQSLLRLILLIVLAGSVGSLVYVLVLMNRNEVLSRIARTEPGKVTWNFPFVLNLFTFGAVPLLTLLSSEFPELRQLLFSWVEPVMKVVVRQ